MKQPTSNQDELMSDTQVLSELDELLVLLATGYLLSVPDLKRAFGDKYQDWVERNKSHPRIVYVKEIIEAHYIKKSEVKKLVMDALPKPSHKNTDFDRGYDKAIEHTKSNLDQALNKVLGDKK